MAKKKSEKSVAAAAVIDAVKKRKLTDREIFSLIRSDWPASQKMIEQLVYFLTTEITCEGEPILYPILEEAFERYQGIVFHNNEKKAEDVARIAVFLEQLITSTVKRLDIQLIDINGACWNLDCGEGFSTWRNAHPGELMTHPYRLNDQIEARRRLYYLMADATMRLVFGRTYYYEDAILAGRIVVDPADRCMHFTGPPSLDTAVH